MNVAEMLVKALEHEGVKYAFGIPGEENLDFVKALCDSEQIKTVLVRHEQGAAFMADVYGRLTGKAGVCFSTLGPGATNLITGVADANGDGAPLVAITAQVTTEKMPLTSHQYLDLDTLFHPITKRTKMLMSPASVTEITRLAFKYAEGDRPGATHICIPQDVAQMQVPEGASQKLIKRPVLGYERADEDEIAEASAEINRAQHPVILVGHGAVLAGAGKALTEFVNRLHIPVINTMMAKGIVSYKNPYYMCTLGIPWKDYPNIMLDKADLVICIGYDIVELAPSKWNKDVCHRIIHIDERIADVNKHYQPDVDVVGDISHSLEEIMLNCDVKAEPKEFLDLKKRFDSELSEYEKDTSFPMKPQRILFDVRKILGPEDIVISDVGAHKMWISRYYNCYKPNTCLISNGFATMGISLPGAIAAKMIYPEKRVLAICGDGGFMMNVQELETAARLNVAMVILVLVDNSYGLIKWKESTIFHEDFCVNFTNPDFVKLAESMSCAGFRVDSAESFIPVMDKAFQCGRPAVVECPVDYAENDKLTEHLKKLT
ncbi:acetolactate synthase-1/2/3 large subunit [Oribacterium sp. WCC10]|nr:acetolactate synthase-1/2/3 large subunit [Oribacterium sp. WCC10]